MGRSSKVTTIVVNQRREPLIGTRQGSQPTMMARSHMPMVRKTTRVAAIQSREDLPASKQEEAPRRELRIR